jgi:hypothetical protein
MIKGALTTAFVLLTITAASFAQEDIKIRKRMNIKMPGMESLANMPGSSASEEMMHPTSTIYIRGSAMRTDTDYKKVTATGLKTRTMTTINQCDKAQTIHFNSDKKKYYVEKAAPQAGIANTSAKRGGYVNVTMAVTDTGERMKLFGQNSRHLKQKITITPGPNACQKTSMEMSIDGWYTDIPMFSCPMKPDLEQLQSQKGCYDEVVLNTTGAKATGIPLKEIKTMSVDGQVMTIEEEVLEFSKTTLSPTLFAPPPNYSPADSRVEVDKDDGSGSTATATTPNAMPPQPAPEPVETTGAPSTLAPPSAGLASQPVGPKAAGILRIGIAQTALELGKDFQSQADPSVALKNTLAVALKTARTETIILDSGLPEQEAKQKDCDFILYTKVTRKKGGGGMFGMMGPMLASTALSMIPGVGMIAGVAVQAVMTTATLSGGFKSKDEVAFEFHLSKPDGTAVIPSTTTKQKAKKDGEDVLTPQIETASKTILGKINPTP